MTHRLNTRRSWLRLVLALWLVGISLVQVVPQAVAGVPPLDGPVPCLEASQGQDGPRSLFEEPDPLPPWPTAEAVSDLVLPPPSAMSTTPLRVLVPSGPVDRLDRPPTP